jgi:LDH2 family malate/lactate/ureidoglycolate dehydrogenase
MHPDRNEVLIRYDDLKELCLKILTEVGLPKREAEIVSGCLLKAELRGVDSHGVSRIPIYVKRLKLGLIKPKARKKIIKKYGSIVVIDGDHGMGHVIGTEAMKECIRTARTKGIAFAGVINSTHFGIASYYTILAAEQDMIGFSSSNSSPRMAPWGSSKALLGTNPISIAIPTGIGFPLVLDMATSTVALGKIMTAAKQGEKIPIGWAIDRNGKITQDPNKALKGSVLPFSGPKGSGLSLVLDILCGTLSGGCSGTKVNSMYRNLTDPEYVGNFLGAINIRAFSPIEEFKKQVDYQLNEIRDSRPANGFDKVLVPGEIEYEKELANLKNGIPIKKGVVKELIDITEELNLFSKYKANFAALKKEVTL